MWLYLLYFQPLRTVSSRSMGLKWGTSLPFSLFHFLEELHWNTSYFTKSFSKTIQGQKVAFEFMRDWFPALDVHVLLYWARAGQSKSSLVYAELCHVVLNLGCQLGQQCLPEHSGQMSMSVPQDCKHDRSRNVFAVQMKKDVSEPIISARLILRCLSNISRWDEGCWPACLCCGWPYCATTF